MDWPGLEYIHEWKYECMNNWLKKIVKELMNEWKNECMKLWLKNEWMKKWRNEGMKEWKTWKNEWLNEMNERMNERMNEWKNEWMNEWNVDWNIDWFFFQTNERMNAPNLDNGGASTALYHNHLKGGLCASRCRLNSNCWRVEPSILGYLGFFPTLNSHLIIEDFLLPSITMFDDRKTTGHCFQILTLK